MRKKGGEGNEGKKQKSGEKVSGLSFHRLSQISPLKCNRGGI